VNGHRPSAAESGRPGGRVGGLAPRGAGWLDPTDAPSTGEGNVNGLPSRITLVKIGLVQSD